MLSYFFNVRGEPMCDPKEAYLVYTKLKWIISVLEIICWTKRIRNPGVKKINFTGRLI